MPVAAQSQEIWTLDSVVTRFLEIAPEAQEAAALIRANEGALQQAGRWPNPTVGLRADDRIGKETTAGGTSLTQLSFSQAIPLSGRVGRQVAVAGAKLEAASASQRYQQLMLETQAARVFHELQFTTAKLSLAKERLILADELRDAGQRRAHAGDIAQLEELRIGLIRESAEQEVDIAEGKYSETLSQFRAILMLSGGSMPSLAPLTPHAPVATLEELQALQPSHPALEAENALWAAARSGVSLARAERWPDPELRFFRERDFLNGRTQDVTGFGIGVTIPLWDMNKGRIRESLAQEDQTRARIQTVERDLAARLQNTHLHLNHLIHQAEDYQQRVLSPATKLYDLTRKAYTAGEAEILGLIDANNTYFESQTRYLELLKEAWLEAAELRLAAGQSTIHDYEGDKL